jgi:hypothetical protein
VAGPAAWAAVVGTGDGLAAADAETLEVAAGVAEAADADLPPPETRK